MGKINFPLRFAYVTLKVFSEFSNLNWLFAQTRKNLPLGFKFSFRIIKDFQYPIKLTLNIIKISLLNKESLTGHENYQKIAGFHRISDFVCNRLASGSYAPVPQKNAYFLKFSIVLPKACRKIGQAF